MALDRNVGRSLALFGYLSPAAGAVTVAVSWLVGDVSLLEQPVSAFGVDASAAGVFAVGLSVTGLLALGAAASFWLASRNLFQRAAAVSLAVSAVSLVGVAVYPMDQRLHLPFAAAFFVFATYSLFLWGSGEISVGERRRALRDVWLGVLQFTVWIAWAPLSDEVGMAAPELAAAAAFSAWMVLLAGGVRHRPADNQQ